MPGSAAGFDARIGSGNFIGEISFLIDGPATADVIAPKGVSYIRWERKKLTADQRAAPLAVRIGVLQAGGLPGIAFTIELSGRF